MRKIGKHLIITNIDLELNAKGEHVLPYLGDDVTSIELDGVTLTKSLLENLSAEITEITVINGINFEEEPQNWPVSLEKLTFINCPKMQELKNLPPYLKELLMYSCNGFKSLKNPPATLTKFVVEGSPDFEKEDPTSEKELLQILLTKLKNFEQIHLTGSTNLSSEGGNQLFELDDQYDIGYPDDFNPYVQRLAQVKAPEVFVNLLNRFLTEKVSSRGNKRDIISQADPVIAALEKNPDLLKEFEKIAQKYSFEGVAQSVAAFAEISALASASLTENFIEKIDIAKQLPASHAVKKIVKDQPAARR